MDWIHEVARRTPLAVAVQTSERSWRYGELDALVQAAADRLSEAGLQGDGPVALRAPASVTGLVSLLALWRMGASPLLIHDRWTETEVEEARRVSGVPCFVDASSQPSSGEWAALRFEYRYGEGDRAIHVEPAVEEEPEPTGRLPEIDDPVAAWLWTSGTSGPKTSIPITWPNLTASATGAGERLHLGSGDGWYAALSPAHIGGLALLTRAIFFGSRLIVSSERPEFDANELATRIRDGVVTHASLVPVMLRRLMDAWGDDPIPPSLRCLLIGGAACPARDVERALRRGWPIALTYGLTEATSQVATAPPTQVRAKPGTVGAPLPGVEVRVGDAGEIEVHGPTVTPGASDEDGWLRTGDLGRIDDDGDLWVTGRRSERIVSGGVTIDPSEVEEAIRDVVRGGDAAVVGMPDPEWGERVVAFVRPDPSHSFDRDSVIHTLTEALRERLSAPKRPKEIHLVEEIPRNANGKVDRTALAERLLSKGSRG